MPTPATVIATLLLRRKAEQTHEVIDGRTIGRNIRVIRRGNRVGEVVAAARVTVGTPQFASMNFRIETWSA